MTISHHPTRTKIIDAALELLGRAGPEGFSASALARAAGVSKATLFHHFATLDEVPMAAFETLLLGLMEQPDQAEPSLRGYLAALGAGVVELSSARRAFLSAYFVFFNRAMFDPQMRELLQASIQRLHAGMRDTLTARLPAGTAPERVEATVRLVEMALDGLGLHLLVSAAPELELAWQRLVDLIVRDAEDGL